MEEKENFRHLALDLGDTAALIRKLNQIFPSGEYKEIVLINNAAWIGEIAPLGKLDPEDIQAVQAINLIAPAILMNEYVRKYGEIKTKKIVINISSGAASKAMDGWSGYCSSKAGLNQLTLVAGEESALKNLGIRYYALSPGIIDTAMQESIRASSKENFSKLDRFRSYHSEGDLSSPEDTADKVLFLIERAGDFEGALQDVREF